ncbi:MAG: HXXEE domain-containing protein [Anaerolineales bacterium]|nr:HXXEE domain-containing protein [Anaerolineales bacterium]
MDSRIKRAFLVMAQCLAMLGVAYLTHWSLFATQIVITIFLCVMIVAFIMHITLSIATHTPMPGLSTSVFPGLPVGLYLLYFVWHI